jgi:hypothetical protein
MLKIDKIPFIYQKENSITSEICDDIIESFTNKLTTEVNMEAHCEYKKIVSFLLKEINSHMKVYCNQLKQYLSICKEDLININICILPTFSNDHRFILNKTYINNVSEKNHIQILNKYNSRFMSKFIYMWFLNDYDGEIIFSEDVKITPKCGKLIIFPVSWCFSYEENIRLFTTKYVIRGYIIH